VLDEEHNLYPSFSKSFSNVQDILKCDHRQTPVLIYTYGASFFKP
jgi:hypothetical protein